MKISSQFPLLSSQFQKGMNLLGNYGSDDEDFVVGALMPHTIVNGRTRAHLLILSFYFCTNTTRVRTVRTTY